jgi:ABC-type transport system involved in cytochrome bd biosynthesis fused ATPase/permease subunit
MYVGTSAYPVSVFTNAPEEVFISILSSISSSPLLSQQPIKNNDILARFDDISISTPDHSRTLITSLSFILHKHKHILITGPNGAGKSTLLRALCNIYPRNSGSITWYLKENPLIGPCCSDAASSPAAAEYYKAVAVSAVALPAEGFAAPRL